MWSNFIKVPCITSFSEYSRILINLSIFNVDAAVVQDYYEQDMGKTLDATLKEIEEAERICVESQVLIVDRYSLNSEAMIFLHPVHSYS